LKRWKVSNVISFKGKSTNVTFYEVVDEQGIAIWGGGDVTECIRYWRNGPVNSRIFVTNWSEDGEDAVLVGEPIDVSYLVLAGITNTLDRITR
jgi:hypothetical protein